MNQTPLLERLRELDAEPPRPLSERESQVKHDLLAEIIMRPDPSPSPRRRGLIVAGAFAAALAVGVTVAIVVARPATPTGSEALGTGTLSPRDVASWTSVPTRLIGNSAVERACARHVNAEPGASGPTTVSNAEVRGSVRSAIVYQGEYSGWCVVGSGGVPMFVLLDSPQFRQPVPSANAIFAGPSGRNTSPDGYSFAEGTVGADVSSVTLHQGGLDIVATVDHGRWTAWWPNLDSDLDGATIYGTFEVITTGGEKYSYSAAEVALP